MKLSDAMHDAVPEQPATGGWGPKVRGRVARRRAAVGAVAGVAVIALAVPLALNLNSPTLVATPEASPTDIPVNPPAYPVAMHEMVACRAADGTRVELTDLPDGKLPAGAERVWLCGGGQEGSVVNDTELVGARDALTVGVDRAVEAFNELTYRPGAAIDCFSDDSAYHVVFEYPDGGTQVIRGLNTRDGCDHFQLSDGVVEDGAQGYLDLLEQLWSAQRESLPPPAADVHLCPTATSVWGIDPATLVRGWSCVPAEAGGKPGFQDALPADLAERILAGVREAKQLPVQVHQTAPRIIMVNDWGDPLTMRWQNLQGQKVLVWGSGVDQAVWHPDAATAAEIEALFEPTGRVGDDRGTEPPVLPEPAAPVPPVPTDLAACPSATDKVNKEISLSDLVPHGYVCLETADGVVTRPLDDTLAADLLADLLVNAEPRAQQPLFMSDERIALWTRDGRTLSISWMGGGTLATYPGDVWTTRFLPVELADRVYAALTDGAGSCVAAPTMSASEVVVDVVDAAGDPALAERVAEGLREAGFTVADATRTGTAELGGPIILRYSAENEYAAGWVGNVLGGNVSGALSGTDDVIEVVVTAEYDPDVGFVPVEAARPQAPHICETAG